MLHPPRPPTGQQGQVPFDLGPSTCQTLPVSSYAHSVLISGTVYNLSPQPKLIQGGSGGTNKIRCVQRLCRLESICRYYSAALRSTTSHVPKANQTKAQFWIVIELLSLRLQSPPYDRPQAIAPQSIEGPCYDAIRRWGTVGFAVACCERISVPFQAHSLVCACIPFLLVGQALLPIAHVQLLAKSVLAPNDRK